MRPARRRWREFWPIESFADHQTGLPADHPSVQHPRSPELPEQPPEPDRFVCRNPSGPSRGDFAPLLVKKPCSLRGHRQDPRKACPDRGGATVTPPLSRLALALHSDPVRSHHGWGCSHKPAESSAIHQQNNPMAKRPQRQFPEMQVRRAADVTQNGQSSEASMPGKPQDSSLS